MLLRHFYIILCILVCIEWVFCYEYISEHRPRRQSRKDLRRRRRHRGRSYKRNVEIEEPVEQIDVASFIQQPDYDAVVENGYNEFRNMKRQQGTRHKKRKDFSVEHSLNNLLPKNARNQTKRRNDVTKELISLPQLNEPDSVPSKNKKNREKGFLNKCSVNFPFFSRKKSKRPKPKKNKKRKYSSSSIDGPVIAYEMPTASKPKAFIPNSINKVQKRSFQERLCPVCRKKIASKKNKVNKDKKLNTIHNSRQYFQELNSKAKEAFNVVSHQSVNNKKSLRFDDERAGNFVTRKSRRRRSFKKDVKNQLNKEQVEKK